MSQQRAAAFKTYFDTHKENPRPLLVSLNGDNSWLISIPRPLNERKTSGKVFFHVVSDPWLVGPSIQWHQWIAHISLPDEPDFKDGDGVEGLVDAIEAAAADSGLLEGRADDRSLPLVDAIFLGIHLIDHTHQPTLETFDHRIPVVASKAAADLVRAWKHFDSVTATNELKPSNGNWQDLHPGTTVPPWLSFFRIAGEDYLHFASVITWMSSGTGESESIFMMPHGIKASGPSVQAYAHGLTPAIKTLAMFCPLKDNYALGMLVVQGSCTGLAVEREVKAKYWVRSGDAELQYSGLLFRTVFIKDVKRTLDEALEAEKKVNGSKVDEVLRRPTLVDVPNGRCFVLD